MKREHSTAQLQTLLLLFHYSLQLTPHQGCVMSLRMPRWTRLPTPIMFQQPLNFFAQPQATGPSNEHYLLWENDDLFAIT